MKQLNPVILLSSLLANVFLVSQFARAQVGGSNEIINAAIDFPPLSFHKGGVVVGASVDVVREMAKRAGKTVREIQIPITRIDEINDSMAAVYSVMTKSEKRKDQLAWIGKLTDDAYCFATLKNKKPIESMDEAKKLKSVGVNQGGSSEAVLIKAGFTNRVGSDGLSGNARKLFAGVIEAWWSTRYTYKTAVKAAGKNPEEVICTGDYNKHEYWIAATKKLPEAQLTELQTSFKTLEKEGFVKKSIDSFLTQ